MAQPGDMVMVMDVRIPEVFQPGQSMLIAAPTGQHVQIEIPQYANPGSTIQVTVPSPQPHQSHQQAVVSPTTLTEALKAARLDQYEEALRGMGCTEKADINDLDEQDLVELGMGRIEIKRLQRLVGELSGSQPPVLSAPADTFASRPASPSRQVVYHGSE